MKWFKKLFIKDYASTGKPEVRTRYGIAAGVFGICSNAVICALKLVVGIIGGSVTVIADAVNNLSDAGSSAVTVAGFKLASRPADREHPYGHARYEYISALVVAVIILIIGVLLCKSSVEKMISPEEVTIDVWTYAVLAFSIVMKLLQMAIYLDFAKSISSGALKASAADSRNDVIATSAVLVAAIVMDITGVNVDAYFGLAVSVFIVATSFKYILEAANPLLGTRPPEEVVAELKAEILAYDGVIGVHDLAVHSYGEGRYFAVAHLEVPARDNLMFAHDLADNIEREVREKTGIMLTLHLDPIDTDDAELEVLKERCEKVLESFDEGLSLHDFRLVRGATHTNIIFDVEMPFESKLGIRDVEKRLEEEFAGESKPYYFVLSKDSE